MGMIKEFKDFAVRGNVIDMAVGVVIGGAFGKIVTALVEKVFMPVLGIVTSGVNFTDAGYTLRAAQGETPAVVLGYGALIQSLIDFTLVALIIFMLVKAINKLKTPPAAPAAAEPSAQEKLLTEIRDLLKAK